MLHHKELNVNGVEVELNPLYGVFLRYGYTNIGLELADAVRVAREILTFAQQWADERAGIDEDEVAPVREALGEDAVMAFLERMAAAADARADAVSAHWGHD